MENNFPKYYYVARNQTFLTPLLHSISLAYSFQIENKIHVHNKSLILPLRDNNNKTERKKWKVL